MNKQITTSTRNCKNIAGKCLAALLVSLVFCVAPVRAQYSFSQEAPSGQTLYYQIIDDHVAVVYPIDHNNIDGHGENNNYISQMTGELTIPDSVTYENFTYPVTELRCQPYFHDYDFYQYGAFYHCHNLTAVLIPNTVTTLDMYTFHNCTNLNLIELPNSVTDIEVYAFGNCTSLNYIYLPESVTHISSFTFYGCTGLNFFVIPVTVTSIGTNIFEGCTNLDIYYEAANCVIANDIYHPFNGCLDFDIHFENSVRTIPANLCTGITELQNVYFGDSITYIGENAFAGCTGIGDVNLFGDSTHIAASAFSNCTSLGYLNLGSGVVSIGDNAFANCSDLYSIVSERYEPPTLGTNVFLGIDDDPYVRVPCNTVSLYETAWSDYDFDYIEEFPFSYMFAYDHTQGYVDCVQNPTCDDATLTLQAIPLEGYRFDHWSNGSTDNPYSMTVTETVFLEAFFVESTAIDEAELPGAKVYAQGSQIVVEGCEAQPVSVFDITGRRLAHVGEANASFTFNAPAAGVYLVRIADQATRKVVVTQ